MKRLGKTSIDLVYAKLYRDRTAEHVLPFEPPCRSSRVTPPDARGRASASGGRAGCSTAPPRPAARGRRGSARSSSPLRRRGPSRARAEAAAPPSPGSWRTPPRAGIQMSSAARPGIQLTDQTFAAEVANRRLWRLRGSATAYSAAASKARRRGDDAVRASAATRRGLKIGGRRAAPLRDLARRRRRRRRATLHRAAHRRQSRRRAALTTRASGRRYEIPTPRYSAALARGSQARRGGGAVGTGRCVASTAGAPTPSSAAPCVPPSPTAPPSARRPRPSTPSDRAHAGDSAPSAAGRPPRRQQEALGRVRHKPRRRTDGRRRSGDKGEVADRACEASSPALTIGALPPRSGGVLVHRRRA